MLSHARASRHAGQSRPRTSSRHPVAGIQPGDLAGLRQRRIVECILDEIIDIAFEVERGLADMNQLWGVFAENICRPSSGGSWPRSILVSLWSPISIRPYFGP